MCFGEMIIDHKCTVETVYEEPECISPSGDLESELHWWRLVSVGFLGLEDQKHNYDSTWICSNCAWCMKEKIPVHGIAGTRQDKYWRWRNYDRESSMEKIDKEEAVQ